MTSILWEQVAKFLLCSRLKNQAQHFMLNNNELQFLRLQTKDALLSLIDVERHQVYGNALPFSHQSYSVQRIIVRFVTNRETFRVFWGHINILHIFSTKAFIKFRVNIYQSPVIWKTTIVFAVYFLMLLILHFASVIIQLMDTQSLLNSYIFTYMLQCLKGM